MTAVGLPCAMTSGFMRPSAVGPMLLNEALSLSGVTAPTVMMSCASAGTLIFFHEAIPSLPALFMSSMPLAASIEAVREIRAVWPSS